MPHKDPEARREYLRQYAERRRVRRRARYAADPEKFSEEQRIYRATNPEVISQTNHRSHMKHRDERLARKRLDLLNMTAEKREEYLAYHRQYRIDNYEKMCLQDKLYKQSHPEEKKIIHARRRARKLRLPDTFTQEQHQFMLQYWGYACAVCGNQEGFQWTLALDHWIPLSSSNCPGTIATNMLPLCHGRGGCNNTKTGKNPHDWLLARHTRQRAAHIEKTITAYFAEAQKRFGGAALAS